METLRELISRRNEFHLFKNSVRTGLVRIRAADIFLDLHVPADSAEEYEPHDVTEDTRQIFTPRDGVKIGTVNGDFFTNVRIVEIIQKSVEHGLSVKACFQHRVSGDIVLVTAHNYVPVEQHVPSVKDGWFILTCDMIAPGHFWNAIKLRL